MPGSVVASGESGETLLRVQGLGKRFGRHVVLEDVELTVKAGRLVALAHPKELSARLLAYADEN